MPGSDDCGPWTSGFIGAGGRTIGALGGPDSLAPGADDWGPWMSGFVGARGGQ